METREQEWDNYNRLKLPSSSSSSQLLSSNSSCFSEYSSIITNSLHAQILENSPRSLMSSLQESPRNSDHQEGLMVWKVRTNDIAVQEILKERREGLASGKIKGRRLFEGSSEDIGSECFDYYFCHDDHQESDHEERSLMGLSSYDSDHHYVEDDKKWFHEYSSLNDDHNKEEEETGKDLMEGDDEKVEMKEEKGTTVVVVQYDGNLGGKNKGGRWMVGMAWFGVLTMALTFGLISMTCKRGNHLLLEDHDQVFLVPT